MHEQPCAAPYLRALLELLESGAPAEELSVQVERARAEGVPAAELREVEQAAGTALRIRSTLRQHRRREQELTALFDTAGDLAAATGLDTVLRAIVHRVRSLLGTDTAYLTLPDEVAGDTYMRVTEGSVSQAFQQLRLSLGDGLGGLVAQTARPYATPDYRIDPRFHHTGSIDAGVLDEGLVSILGVPLLLGSRTDSSHKVVGVLFAADRAPRSFSQDEIALLQSLATHAAVAIDTASSIAETRQALDELAAANEIVRRQTEALRRAEEAHDRLTDLVLRGGDVPEVTTALARLLHGPISLHDPEGIPLAATDEHGAAFPLDDTVADWLPAASEDSREVARAVHRAGHWVCAVLAGPEVLATLVLHDHRALEDTDRRLFERASVVTGLLVMLRRRAAETENRLRGNLIADLLDAPGQDPGALIERGRRLGIDLRRPHLVLVADTAQGARERLNLASLSHLAHHPGTVSAEHHGSLVLLRSLARKDVANGPEAALASEPGRLARDLARQWGRAVGAPVTVAAAGPASGLTAVVEAHAEASRCLRALHALGRTGDGADISELGFLGVVLGENRDTRTFVDASLGPLLAYDAERGTELVRTLEAYFASGQILTRAKDLLHVHVNTVVQRLARIQHLLGADWNTPERALELHLALRLHAVAARDS
ncbi:helix-turn-helix domain-containing protein [Streptomyces benahoarensis]|uniref:GAF domain-containing protein n=1 Tax=Streptomyces benahoarensis TaxID=2595054 RepID=A0A553ZRV7_9ACTN|nr:GAF domain-containing protein [Streptomyces benahoarensis]TSB32652.1 GAF domain-containing protein [Streptomyces benahoarensis]TSB44208.1 GAF domain-containing protein [Streptomyces benahoarensis]